MMETIDIVTQLISNLGFPIAMCAYFIWDKTKVTNNLVTAINNNTLVITRFLEATHNCEVKEHE